MIGSRLLRPFLATRGILHFYCIFVSASTSDSCGTGYQCTSQVLGKSCCTGTRHNFSNGGWPRSLIRHLSLEKHWRTPTSRKTYSQVLSDTGKISVQRSNASLLARCEYLCTNLSGERGRLSRSKEPALYIAFRRLPRLDVSPDRSEDDLHVCRKCRRICR